MRPFLVTKFFCSKCGAALGVEYGKDAEAKPRDSHDPGIDYIREPTGADMVYTTVLIKPCHNCLKPVRDVAEAMAAIKRIIDI